MWYTNQVSKARKARSARRRPANDWRLAQVTIFEPALGDKVTLHLEDSRTILVGRNGVGKSLLLESFTQAARLAVHRTPYRTSSRLSFSCELKRGNDRLRYDFSQKLRQPEKEEDFSPGFPSIDWREKCSRVSSNETLWSVTDGVAKIGGEQIKLERGIGLLSVTPPASIHVPEELSVVRDLLLRVRRVQSGVPRQTEQTEPRGHLLLLRSSAASHKPWSVSGQHSNHRVVDIARSIMNWHESDRERFDEYEAVGKRLGLWTSLDARILQRQVMGLAADSEARDFDLGIVAADDINFACLSDGTLRTAEILCALLGPMSGVLLVEEPETSIHPGLLRRLLSEVEAYSVDKQIVISTHSPDVVSKALPGEIRLVRRTKDKTSVHRLSEAETGRLQEYLCDEGTLGEFIFGGGASDE